MTRATRIALGDSGFERAVIWSAVGFALSYVAFDAVALVTPIAGPSTGTAVTLSALVALTAVGVVAFAAIGGGVLPAILLAYGPFVAVLLRAIGPEPYAIPVTDPLPFAVALAEPLGVALAGAVAVGLAGYLVGRVAIGLLADGNAGEGTDAESKSEAKSKSESAAASGTAASD